MNCTQFEDILHDLDRDGTKGLVLRESALAHAESCDHCAQLMTESESLDFHLQNIVLGDTDLQVPPRIEAALLDEFRSQNFRSSRRNLAWRLSALATAAIVLFVLGISVRLAHAPNPGAAPPVRTAADSSNSQTASDVQPANIESTGSDAAAQLNQAGNSEASGGDDATAFVSLPYANDPETLEGGAIVRVVLSRPALASLGVPVTDVGATDQIPADIVLSEDGAPQAIRLVSKASVDY